jgi:hypothetical protein
MATFFTAVNSGAVSRSPQLPAWEPISTKLAKVIEYHLVATADMDDDILFHLYRK